MFQRLCSAIVALALAAPLLAQSPAPAAPAAPLLSPASQEYANFALGKWAELQAETHAGGTYIQQALDDFAAARKANPDSAFLTAQTADLYSLLGRNTEAIPLLESAIQAHPDSLIAHQTLGEIYIRQLSHGVPAAQRETTFAAAIAEYGKIAALDPHNPSPRVLLGKLYGASGQPALAEQQFRTALATAPTNLDAITSLIQALADQNHMDQAQQEVDALPPAAQAAPVYAALGDAWQHDKQYPQAVAAFRQAVTIEPDNPDYTTALGQSTLRIAQLDVQTSDLAAAAANLKSASSLLGVDNLEVANTTVELDEAQGDTPAAIAGLQALIARKTPASSQSLFLEQLARLQARTGDTSGALASCASLTALGADYTARARDLQVEVYSTAHDYPHALAIVEAALKTDPASRSLHLSYATLLADSGHPDDALASLTSLMHGDASDWDLFLAEARIRQTAGQWADAVTDAQRADGLAADPTQHAQALDALGWTYFKMKNLPDALATLQKAATLDQRNAVVRDHLAQVQKLLAGH